MSKSANPSTDAKLDCGVIMPISATTGFDAAYWSDVQFLHHRAIRQAGLDPKNVWTGSSVDRITPRILGNLFEVPIALCDITDLNANVMLELGMRLTSKKPTVVVSIEGAKRPFDINDFEIVSYPKDLNIIGMERYFEAINVTLKD